MLNPRASHDPISPGTGNENRGRVPGRYAERSDRSGAVWLFGLQWAPLIGGRAAAQARSRARRAGATHFIWAGDRGIVAGHAHLPTQREAQWVSAALAFANAYSEGVVAAVLPLQDGRFWVVAAQDATVIARTDVLFHTAAEAFTAFDALVQSLPGCSTLEVPDAEQFLEALCAKPLPSLTLRRVQAVWIGHVRRFRLAAMVVLALGTAWWLGRSSEHPAASVASRDDLSPAQRALAWQDAVRRQWSTTRVHLPTELRRVMASMERLPIDLEGWGLRQATCRASTADWVCEAAFARDLGHATNADFQALVPPGWQVRFDLLSGAALTWSVPTDATPLSDVLGVAPAQGRADAVDASSSAQRGDQDATRESVDLRLASHMQRISAAFTQVSLSARQAVPLLPPLDAAGQPIARTVGMPELWQRVLKLEGPLRSFALFAQPPATIAWHEVIVGVETPPGVSLKLSPLTARLTGLVYEQL